MVPIFFIGLGVIAHFIPPTAPDRDAVEIAELYRDHHGRIQLGVYIAAGAAVLLAPFFATLGVQMRRIEGRHSVLAYIQMMCGALLVLVFMIPMFTWQAAAFRPERAAETTQALNDLAWLPFVGIVWTVLMQWLVIAIAILSDRRPNPVFPRWAGYLNLWACVGIFPGTLIVFFKDGPLAWNGIVGWWVLIVTFFIWMCAMAWLMFRAIDQQEREEAEGGPASPQGLEQRVATLEAELRVVRGETTEERR